MELYLYKSVRSIVGQSANGFLFRRYRLGQCKALPKSGGDLLTVNLGTGRGVSVLEMVHAFEQATGQKIPYKIVNRRPGDIAECYADASLAKQILGWQANYTIEQMCYDAWHWQAKNPNGYAII